MLRAYVYKLLRSPLLYISFVGTFLICLSKLTFFLNSGNVASEIDMLLNLNGLRKIMPLFAALPFAANFAEEWNNGMSISIISRSSVTKYATANVLICFMSGLLTVFIPIIIFALVYSFSLPMSDNIYYIQPYGVFVEYGMPFLYISCNAFVYASCAAMWAVMGLMLSAFFVNKYAAICSPLIMGYVIERFTMGLPDPLNIWYVSVSNLRWESAFGQFLYSVGFFVGISAICGIVFTKIVKRRVSNELV